MKLLVYMRDGRTVYKIANRGLLGKLISCEPDHGADSLFAVRGIWNPVTGEYMWSDRIYLRFLSKTSIAFVEEERGQAPA